MSMLILRALPAMFAAMPLTAQAYDQLPKPLARLSPEQVAQKIRIENDPLDRFMTLSTQPSWQRGRSITGAYATDVHLRALVDRETGKTRWQVWHELDYRGNARHFTAVAYRTGGQRVEVPLQDVENWNDYNVDNDGFRRHSQHARIVFELPEGVVMDIAASYRAGSREPWRLRFVERGGQNVTGGLAPSEVAGLVQALQKWQGQAR